MAARARAATAAPRRGVGSACDTHAPAGLTPIFGRLASANTPPREPPAPEEEISMHSPAVTPAQATTLADRQHPKVARRSLVAALLLAAASAPAAAAADLPTGTFKIQSAHGLCAQASSSYLETHGCSTGNLSQQFVYDLVTKQIRPVSALGKCAQSDVSVVELARCDNTTPRQKWGREGLAVGGDRIYPYDATNKGWNSLGDIEYVYLDASIGTPGVNYSWSFPLI
jgi:hypothetical protein